MKREIFTAEVLTNSRRLVVGYILKNSGSIEDANDTLQDGFEAYIVNIRKPNFKLTTKPEIYIFYICKNLWLNHLKSKKRKIEVCGEIEELPCIEDEQINLKKRKEVIELIVDKNVKLLSQKCQDIFRFRKEGLSCEQIAQKMNFKKGSISKDKFYRCKKRLLEIIADDKEYIDFKSEEVEINEY